MLFYDTPLLPYSPIETLLNPLSSIWRWLFPTSLSQRECDQITGTESATVTSKEEWPGLNNDILTWSQYVHLWVMLPIPQLTYHWANYMFFIDAFFLELDSWQSVFCIWSSSQQSLPTKVWKRENYAKSEVSNCCFKLWRRLCFQYLLKSSTHGCTYITEQKLDAEW